MKKTEQKRKSDHTFICEYTIPRIVDTWFVAGNLLTVAINVDIVSDSWKENWRANTTIDWNGELKAAANYPIEVFYVRIGTGMHENLVNVLDRNNVLDEYFPPTSLQALENLWNAKIESFSCNTGADIAMFWKTSK